MVTDMPPAVHQVCNIDLLYGDEYSYSLPREALETFLSGKAFDNKELYTEEETRLMWQDITDLYDKIIGNNPMKAPLAVMTAGAPGAGKTIKLKQELEELEGEYAYVCPDDVCLKNQEQTFLADLERSDKSPKSRKALYDKWRPASNAMTHLLLGHLIRENYAF